MPAITLRVITLSFVSRGCYCTWSMLSAFTPDHHSPTSHSFAGCVNLLAGCIEPVFAVCTYCVQQLVLCVASYWHDDCPHSSTHPGVFQAFLNLVFACAQAPARAGVTSCILTWMKRSCAGINYCSGQQKPAVAAAL